MGHPVELVTVHNDHGVPLDGVFWAPEGADPVAAGIVHLHSKGGNFYTGPSRFVPELTRGMPLAHLALNMRCHDLGTTRSDLACADALVGEHAVGRGAVVDGGMWERISEGHLDVGAAVAFLRARGVERVFLAGHSSGGFYVADYCARDSSIAGRILLSPLTSNRTMLSTWCTRDELNDLLQTAQTMVADGRGELLLPVRHWYYGISARALLERASEPLGRWAEAMAASDAPTLMLWGAKESRADLWSGLLDDLPAPDKERFVVAGGEHHYVGSERAVAQVVADFVLARSAA